MPARAMSPIIEEQIPTKLKYSAARLEKLNLPYFCIYVGLRKK